jgi:hypothetical protein
MHLMLYRFSALFVVLVLCAGGSLADDSKKDAKKEVIKGTVVKYDADKKCVKLNTGKEEKEYLLGDEVTLVSFTGAKLKADLKKDAKDKKGHDAVVVALKTGNAVELVLADGEQNVKEVHQKKGPVGATTTTDK